MLLLDKLKQDLNELDEQQLQKVDQFLSSIVLESQNSKESPEFRTQVSGENCVRSFQEWVDRFGAIGGPSLPDEAFDRGTIYEE